MEHGGTWWNRNEKGGILLMLLFQTYLVIFSCCRRDQQLGREWVPFEALEHSDIDTMDQFPMSRDPIGSNSRKMGCNYSNYIFCKESKF